MQRSKRKPEEITGQERWLVSYADLVTLLLALFVVLFASSKADLQKLKKVREGMQNAFQAFGGSASPHLSPDLSSDLPSPIQPTLLPKVQLRVQSRVQQSPGSPESSTAPLMDLRQQVIDSMSQALGKSDSSDILSAELDSRGLVIRLSLQDFFSVGQARVHPELLPILDRIGAVLAPTRFKIRVIGHSDIAEPPSVLYPSGWELSASRASWVTRHWVERFKIAPERFEVAGYSHFQQATTREQEWFHGNNRRIEIIVLTGGP